MLFVLTSAAETQDCQRCSAQNNLWPISPSWDQSLHDCSAIGFKKKTQLEASTTQALMGCLSGCASKSALAIAHHRHPCLHGTRSSLAPLPTHRSLRRYCV